MSDVAVAPSELAVIAPDVAESQPSDVRPPADMDATTSAVANELRAEAARYDGSTGEGAAGSEAASDSARLLRQFADQLAQPRAWLTIDRFVHDLVSGLVADALVAAHGAPAPALTARAFALKALARQTALWPGAGPRPGCAYGYDSVLASVRLAALAS